MQHDRNMMSAWPGTNLGTNALATMKR